eukprot:c17175_g1_i3.p1 GENE.c17175_g1_i3~~c17175_g1_i3.p1  ORF type:complete len:465 (+),score=116.34 c17175_g1_i3:576-1970(+)
MLEQNAVEPSLRLLEVMHSTDQWLIQRVAASIAKRSIRLNHNVVKGLGRVLDAKNIPVPDTVAGALATVLAKEGNTDKAHVIINDVLGRGGVLKVEHFNSLISAYGKVRNLDKVLDVVEQMKALRIPFSNVTYNCLIDAYALTQNADLALEAFRQMLAKGYTADIQTVNCVMKALCNQGRLAQALQMLERMPSLGFSPSHPTYMSILHACALKQDLATAFEIFEKLQQKPAPTKGAQVFHPIVPDRRLYNALLDVCARVGAAKEARQIMAKMLDPEEGCGGCSSTFTSVMRACLTAGDALGCTETTELMNKHGVVGLPATHAYAIEGYVRAGMHDKAIAYFTSIQHDAAPSSTTQTPEGSNHPHTHRHKFVLKFTPLEALVTWALGDRTTKLRDDSVIRLLVEHANETGTFLSVKLLRQIETALGKELQNLPEMRALLRRTWNVRAERLLETMKPVSSGAGTEA